MWGPIDWRRLSGKARQVRRRCLHIRLSVISAPFKAFVADELSCACLRCQCRSGEARDSLHHWPKSSHQNSQQRKTLRICVDEGKERIIHFLML